VTYLLLDVVERVGGVDGEANQDNVRIGVGKRSETVIILLTGGIPKGQLDVLAIDLDVGNVVLENSGDVHLCKWTCQWMRLSELMDVDEGMDRERS
jgi:hypothetical protein